MSATITMSPRAAAVPQTPMPSPTGRPSICVDEALGQRRRRHVAEHAERAIEQQHGAARAREALLDVAAERVQRLIEWLAAHDPLEDALLVRQLGGEHVSGFRSLEPSEAVRRT